MQNKGDKRTASGLEKDGKDWRAILFNLHLKIALFIVHSCISQRERSRDFQSLTRLYCLYVYIYVHTDRSVFNLRGSGYL